MVLDDFGTKQAAVYMGIDLGSGDGFMPQHGLDGAQIGPAFQEVGGKAVAESVGADVLLQPGGFCQILDDAEHHDAGDGIAPTGQEDVVFETGAVAPALAVDQPEVDLLDGALGDGHQALLAALAFYANEAFVEVEVAELEVAQL